MSGGSVTATYGYTGDNALATQVVGSTTTRYALDTAGGLTERLGMTATTGGTTTSTWYVRGLGGELARQTSGGTAWYLADRLGSVRAEYGTTAGSLGVRTDYDPFGTPEGGPGLVAPGDYGFTGESQDAATGLVQLRARWYAPTAGTFLSRDRFQGEPRSPQTLHSYAYVHNDPGNGLDPTGQARRSVGDTPDLGYLLGQDTAIGSESLLGSTSDVLQFVTSDWCFDEGQRRDDPAMAVVLQSTNPAPVIGGQSKDTCLEDASECQWAAGLLDGLGLRVRKLADWSFRALNLVLSASLDLMGAAQWSASDFRNAIGELSMIRLSGNEEFPKAICPGAPKGAPPQCKLLGGFQPFSRSLVLNGWTFFEDQRGTPLSDTNVKATIVHELAHAWDDRSG